ncbi:hypothetical protein NPIL_403651 [Nephila pilipes]|uniref:Uncharacterized protein n=1 Tax=Nephila pilipes TaxID=299642 RepID=A0A8X6R5R7_NEPPI|nr:hypothetical protein NPIL_403651 [Nephila pilipes]
MESCFPLIFFIQPWIGKALPMGEVVLWRRGGEREGDSEEALAFFVTHFHITGVPEDILDHVLQHIVPWENGVHPRRTVREVQRMNHQPQVGVFLQEAVEVIDEQCVFLLDLLHRGS